MTRCASILICMAILGCATADTPDQATLSGPANPFLHLEPTVVLEKEDVVLLVWEIDNDPGLFGPAPSGLGHLEAWRRKIEKVVGSTDPSDLLRRNREINPWLENEHPGQRKINDQVARGELGRLRNLNALEAYLLDFHAARYPLFDQPSELGSLILEREKGGSPKLRIYYLSDGSPFPPREGVVAILENADADVMRGWNARIMLHNHTFDFESDKGLLAIAAPSENDLQLLAAIHERLGVETAWIIDGFNSFELDLDDLVARGW